MLRCLQVLTVVVFAAAALAGHDDCHTHPLCQVEVDEAPQVLSTQAPPLVVEVQPTEALKETPKELPKELPKEETQIEPTPHFAETLSVENQVGGKIVSNILITGGRL